MSDFITKCPQCGIEAQGFGEIYEKFGYKMKRGGVVEPYSVCKKCSDIVKVRQKKCVMRYQYIR